LKRRHRIPPTPSKRVLFALPEIPDALNAETKNALAIRNQSTVEGKCPSCGCEPEIRRLEPLVFVARFTHADECPAFRDEDAARPAIRGSGVGGGCQHQTRERPLHSAAVRNTSPAFGSPDGDRRHV
jgi:hypothetical protein